MTTIGQRPWLGIRRICIEGVLSELSGWTYYLLFPHMSPARCCFMSTAWVNSHRDLLQWETVHRPQWAALHIVLSMDVRMGLWPEEGVGGGGVGGAGAGGEWRRANWFRNINKTEVHPSKWNSSLTRSDGLCFLLECGKDGAGRSLISEIGFTQKQIPR